MGSAGKCPENIVHLVPGDPGAKFPECLGRVPAGEHSQNVVELRPGKVPVTVRSPDDIVQRIGRPFLHCRHGHDLLREDVETVLRNRCRLHVVVHHPPGYNRCLDKILPVCGEDASFGGGVDQMAGAPHPLEPPGYSFGGLDLHHKVDAAYVDSQLKR